MKPPGKGQAMSDKECMLNKDLEQYRFAATCGRGAEQLVAREVAGWDGHEIVEGIGVVTWAGSLETAYRACLWSRFASRILLELVKVQAVDEDGLYTHACTIDWTPHLDEKSTFAVDCTVSKKAGSIHSRYAALKVKDGIVDIFRQITGDRPSVDTARPDVRINVMVGEKEATFAIDLSGDSLHRRGYRVTKSRAPLKENLAATIVALSGWPGKNVPLVDPMCGSGTLLIEAAMMYGDSAPGLSRSYYGFTGWKGHDSALWDRLVSEALDRENGTDDIEWPAIVGYDSDPESVRAARQNINRAGLEHRIRIEHAELATLAPGSLAEGMLLSNLPFGERLSETEVVAQLYRALGRIARERFGGWQLAVFISNPDLTDSFNLQFTAKHRLYNGSLQCRLLCGPVDGARQPPFVHSIRDDFEPGDGQDFVNRLRKNLKKTLKWAKKNDVSCFRVYDRDLPEYNVSIDVYGKWIQVQEFAAPDTVDSKVASRRFQTVLTAVRGLLGVRSDRLFIKTRKRQRGSGQYQKRAAKKKMLEVEEGGCRYLVNFTDYLDTGLFLDHRPVRLKIGRESEGKRFLNLFSYTGTATIQAAAGGAIRTTSVDLSETYLNWTRMNLALNGFDTSRNRVETGDCMKWLDECKETYDLIFVDPPTFSNTKKEKRVFDIQRDHISLLKKAMGRLDSGGLLIFSTNFRRFRLDPVISELFAVKDISAWSIPEDFSRNRKIHSCWELRKR